MLARVLGKGGKQEGWGIKKKMMQEPRNLSFCFDTPHVHLLGLALLN